MKKKVFVMKPEDIVCAAALEMTPEEYARAKLELWESYYKIERDKITKWLRSLGSETNHFLPATLAGWIEEGMHDI